MPPPASLAVFSPRCCYGVSPYPVTIKETAAEVSRLARERAVGAGHTADDGVVAAALNARDVVDQSAIIDKQHITTRAVDAPAAGGCVLSHGTVREDRPAGGGEGSPSVRSIIGQNAFIDHQYTKNVGDAPAVSGSRVLDHGTVREDCRTGNEVGDARATLGGVAV